MQYRTRFSNKKLKKGECDIFKLSNISHKKNMYINIAKVRIKKVWNGIELFFGIFGLILFGATTVFVSLEENSDGIDVAFFIFTALSILLIIKSLRSKKLIGNIYFYSRYFEGDLDGKIKVSEMIEVIGKSEKQIGRELKKLRRKKLMKNYKINQLQTGYEIELDSIVTKCECKNCGAVIDKKVYFAGLCPYCGGLDINAKQIKQ